MDDSTDSRDGGSVGGGLGNWYADLDFEVLPDPSGSAGIFCAMSSIVRQTLKDA